LDVPCFTFSALLWQTSTLTKGLVPDHDLVAIIFAVTFRVALTAAVVEVEMVVDEFTRLLYAQAGSVDHIPSVISVVTVLHLISASAFIFSVWLPPDELARWACIWTRSQNSVNSCYQMLSARLGKAEAICI
jgi:hypothetical protein